MLETMKLSWQMSSSWVFSIFSLEDKYKSSRAKKRKVFIAKICPNRSLAQLCQKYERPHCKISHALFFYMNVIIWSKLLYTFQVWIFCVEITVWNSETHSYLIHFPLGILKCWKGFIGTRLLHFLLTKVTLCQWCDQNSSEGQEY